MEGELELMRKKEDRGSREGKKTCMLKTSGVRLRWEI